VVVTLLKLLGVQFVEMLQDKGISAVSITAANATNELFEVEGQYILFINNNGSLLVTGSCSLLIPSDYCKPGAPQQ